MEVLLLLCSVIPIFCWSDICATACPVLRCRRISGRRSSRSCRPSARLVCGRRRGRCQRIWVHRSTQWVQRVLRFQPSADHSRDTSVAPSLGTSTVWKACSRTSRSGNPECCSATWKNVTFTPRADTDYPQTPRPGGGLKGPSQGERAPLVVKGLMCQCKGSVTPERPR